MTANPLRLWSRFFFAPISARPLGAFRIVMGLIALAHLALLSVDLDHWLTGRGLLQGSEAREVAGAMRPSPLQWVQDPSSVRAWVVGTAVAAVLVTLGWRTRITSALLYVMMLSIHHRNLMTNCGPDVLLILMLFYLMLSPSGAALSLDARRAACKRGTLAEPLIVPWAQRLIQLQLCLIYFDTAVLKCNGATWLNGTALHFVLNNPEVGRFSLEPLSQYPIAINVLSYAAVLVEFCLAFLLWFRPTRPWVALAGIGLHVGVLLTVNVPLFGELMTACYLTYLTPDELRAISPLRWIRRTQSPVGARQIHVDGPEPLRGLHLPLGDQVEPSPIAD
jgi:hypothetical protein